MNSRVSSGQADRGMRSVSSVTHAPSRTRAVGLGGLDPVLLLDQDQGVTNSLVDGESDGEVAVGGCRWRPRTRGWPRPSRPAPGCGWVDQGGMVVLRSGRSGTPRAVRTGPGGAVRCGRRRRWPRSYPAAAWRPTVLWSCRTTRPTGRTRSPSCRSGRRPASPSTS